MDKELTEVHISLLLQLSDDSIMWPDLVHRAATDRDIVSGIEGPFERELADLLTDLESYSMVDSKLEGIRLTNDGKLVKDFILQLRPD